MLHCLYAAFRLVQEQLTPMLIANGFFHFNLERQATHDHPEQNNASKIRLRWIETMRGYSERLLKVYARSNVKSFDFQFKSRDFTVLITYKAQMSTSKQ